MQKSNTSIKQSLSLICNIACNGNRQIPIDSRFILSIHPTLSVRCSVCVCQSSSVCVCACVVSCISPMFLTFGVQFSSIFFMCTLFYVCTLNSEWVNGSQWREIDWGWLRAIAMLAGLSANTHAVCRLCSPFLRFEAQECASAAVVRPHMNECLLSRSANFSLSCSAIVFLMET